MGYYGAGTATFDANGNLSSASDARLKNLQGYFTRGLADLQNIKPIKCYWHKKSGMETKHLYAGFSAQDVQKSIPEIVYKNQAGILSIDDRALLATAVNAIKELHGKVQDQWQEIEGLGEEIRQLRGIGSQKTLENHGVSTVRESYFYSGG